MEQTTFRPSKAGQDPCNAPRERNKLRRKAETGHDQKVGEDTVMTHDEYLIQQLRQRIEKMRCEIEALKDENDRLFQKSVRDLDHIRDLEEKLNEKEA